MTVKTDVLLPISCPIYFTSVIKGELQSWLCENQKIDQKKNN